MSTFNYPENCTFCSTRFGVNKCLLPFEFVMNFNTVKGSLDTIMDITEFHVHYGTQNLSHNKEFLSWFPDYQSEQAGMIRRACSSVGSFEINLKQTGEKQITSNYSDKSSQADLLDEERSVCTSDLSGIEITERKPRLVSTKESKTWADRVIESVDLMTESSKNESSIKGTELQEEKPTIKSASTEISQLGPQDMSHLIQDLLIAMRSSYAIHEKSRTYIKVWKLFSAMKFEIDVKTSKGPMYKPARTNTLDGEIGLSKELVSKHSNKSISAWETSCHSEHLFECILGFSDFVISDSETANEKLEEALLCYIRSIRLSSKMTKDQINMIFNSASFELQRNGEDKVYAWCMNMTKIQPGLDRSKGKGTANVRSPTVNELKDRRNVPYPAIDERYTIFIENQLSPIVKKTLQKQGLFLPTIPGEIGAEKYFTKLSMEFIKRNSGWRNGNSFTSPSHLSKIIEYTGLPFNSSDSYFIFCIMREILHECRNKFKEIHPSVKSDDGN